MDTLENGKNKLSQICDILRKETLEPAQSEAANIIEKAKIDRQKILDQTDLEAKKMLQQAQEKIEQEKQLFENSMDLAAEQAFNHLKEKISSKLFNGELTALAQSTMKESELIAKLLAAIVNAVDKEGLDANLSLILPEVVKAQEVSKYLAAKAQKRLEKEEIKIETSASSGAQVILKDQKMSVDISEQSLKELLGSFLKDSFRTVLFKNV